MFDPDTSLVLHPPDTLSIFTIPLELTHRILAFCHPFDVAAFSRTCHSAHKMAQDEYLWRQMWYEYPFDDPQLVLQERCKLNVAITPKRYPAENGWKIEFTRRMKAELVASKKLKQYTLLSSKEKRRALGVFLSVLQESLPKFNVQTSDGEFSDPVYSENMLWVQRVLSKSRLIAPVLLSLEDEREISELQAHIRSYLVDYEWSGKTRRALVDRRNKSRAFVYDLQNYSYANDYGPFHIDGKVHWVHVEHLINVVLSNLLDLPSHNITPARPPTDLDSLRPYSAPGNFSREDWAGIEGTWRRYVCFMDYRDLFAFNYSDIADGPLHPKFFEDPRFREATRLIQLKLQIVPQSQIKYFRLTDIEESASVKHPTIFFVGSSKGVHGNAATVEGFVWMAGDGTVRWKLISVYESSPQWSSTGVQMGDVGSARGVIGVWTTTSHEQGDPVGPFWLWKAEEGSSEGLIEYT